MGTLGWTLLAVNLVGFGYSWRLFFRNLLRIDHKDVGNIDWEYFWGSGCWSLFVSLVWPITILGLGIYHLNKRETAPNGFFRLIVGESKADRKQRKISA